MKDADDKRCIYKTSYLAAIPRAPRFVFFATQSPTYRSKGSLNVTEAGAGIPPDAYLDLWNFYLPTGTNQMLL